MGLIGIGKDEYQDMPEPQGFRLCPIGQQLHFTITDHREGTANEGRQNEHEYGSICCTMTDEEGTSYNHWEYFALTAERRPWLKKFMSAVGRSDLLSDDAQWEDLYDTEFLADVTHRKDKKTGEMKSRLVMESITAVSHAASAPAAKAPAPKGAPAPQRAPRGRTPR